MKIAVSVTCTNGYMVLLDHLIKSILRHNPEFDKDFLVYTDEGFAKENETYLLSLYDKFKFIYVNHALYIQHNKDHPKFYSIECFNQSEYDKVIYWGADMLCLKPLDDLWKECEGVDVIAMPKEKRRGDSIPYNNGSMIIDKSIITEGNFVELIRSNYDSMPEALMDQKTYNYFFKGRIQEIHMKYNTVTSELEFIPKDEILMLHYIYKPTNMAGINNLNGHGEWMYKEWIQYDNAGDRNNGFVG